MKSFEFRNEKFSFKLPGARKRRGHLLRHSPGNKIFVFLQSFLTLVDWMGNHVGNAQCVPFGTRYFVLLFPKMCQLSLAVNVLDDQGGPGGTRPPPHAQGGVGVLDDQGGTVGTRQVAHAQGGTVGLGHVAGGRAGRQAVHAQVADDQGAPVGLGHVAGGLAVHVQVVNAHGVTVEPDRHDTALAPVNVEASIKVILEKTCFLQTKHKTSIVIQCKKWCLHPFPT